MVVQESRIFYSSNLMLFPCLSNEYDAVVHVMRPTPTDDSGRCVFFSFFFLFLEKCEFLFLIIKIDLFKSMAHSCQAVCVYSLGFQLVANQAKSRYASFYSRTHEEDICYAISLRNFLICGADAKHTVQENIFLNSVHISLNCVQMQKSKGYAHSSREYSLEFCV